MSTEPKIGLRELKKERTRRLIRHHTLRLIDCNGYAGTTVDQIAEACEIAPSTFFRYYKNKDDAATTDFLDATVFEQLKIEPVRPGESLIPSLRRAIHHLYDTMTDAEWAEERQRMRIIQAVPELQSALAEESMRPLRLSIEVVAERAGLPSDDPLVRAYAGGVVGAMSAVSLQGDHALESYELPETKADLVALFDHLCDLVDTIVVMPPELRAMIDGARS